MADVEARLAEHEQAVEAAMCAIRCHSEQIETHTQIVRDALAIETTQARKAPVRRMRVPSRYPTRRVAMAA